MTLHPEVTIAVACLMGLGNRLAGGVAEKCTRGCAFGDGWQQCPGLVVQLENVSAGEPQARYRAWPSPV